MFLIHLGVPLKIALEGTYFDELVYQQPDKTCVLDRRVALKIKLGIGKYTCHKVNYFTVLELFVPLGQRDNLYDKASKSLAVVKTFATKWTTLPTTRSGHFGRRLYVCTRFVSLCYIKRLGQ